MTDSGLHLNSNFTSYCSV